MIDLPYLEKWEVLHKKLSGLLYFGITHGLFEYTLGLAQLFTHKKTVVVVEGQTFYFEDVLPQLLQSQLNLVRVKHSEIKSAEEFVKNLAADTLFVLHADDHPVTGEIFPSLELDKFLAAKRIFSIRISHAVHRYRAEELQPYTVLITKLSADRALAKVGTRVKGKPLMAHRLPWNIEEELAHLLPVLSPKKEYKTEIQNLESALGSVAPAFLSTENRIYDRILLVCKGLHAHSVKELLALEKIQTETLTTADQGFYKNIEGWWSKDLPANLVRELLIVSAENLDFSHLQKSFPQIVQKVKSLQTV